MNKKLQRCDEGIDNIYAKLSFLDESDSDLAVRLEPDSILTEAASVQENNLLREHFSLKNDLSDVQEQTAAQKEIYEMKEERAHRHITELKEMYAYCDTRSQATKTITDRLKYVLKNKDAFVKITPNLRDPVDPNSLQIPNDLHKETVRLFEGMAEMCNSLDQSLNVASKLPELDVMNVFSKLEAQCTQGGIIATFTGNQVETLVGSGSHTLAMDDSLNVSETAES